MSFSWDIKKRLCGLENNSIEIAKFELAGIVGFSGDFSDSRLRLMTEHQLLVERISRDIELSVNYKPKITGEKTNKIQIEDEELLEKLRECVFLGDAQTDVDFEKEISENDEFRSAYVRGAFLSGGCVLAPEKSYHLEFDTKYKKSSARLKNILIKMGYAVRETYRKGHYLVYIKDFESIADILGYIGAGGAALEFYSIQAEKDIRNDINREINCYTANANKQAAAAGKQLAAIKKIEKTIGLSELPSILQELAKLRLENPEEGLAALGQMLTPPLGKSGVNHRMNKILEISNNL